PKLVQLRANGCDVDRNPDALIVARRTGEMERHFDHVAATTEPEPRRAISSEHADDLRLALVGRNVGRRRANEIGPRHPSALPSSTAGEAAPCERLSYTLDENIRSSTVRT